MLKHQPQVMLLIFQVLIHPETATTHTYAVEILEQNKDFLVAEVHAYIGVQYPVIHMI